MWIQHVAVLHSFLVGHQYSCMWRLPMSTSLRAVTLACWPAKQHLKHLRSLNNFSRWAINSKVPHTTHGIFIHTTLLFADLIRSYPSFPSCPPPLSARREKEDQPRSTRNTKRLLTPDSLTHLLLRRVHHPRRAKVVLLRIPSSTCLRERGRNSVPDRLFWAKLIKALSLRRETTWWIVRTQAPRPKGRKEWPQKESQILTPTLLSENITVSDLPRELAPKAPNARQLPANNRAWSPTAWG